MKIDVSAVSVTEEMFRSHSQPYVSRLVEPCKACGCTCQVCVSNPSNSLDLHREIQELNSNLVKANARSSQLEAELVESHEFSDSEIAKLQDETAKLRDRYDRLYESHKKLQKLNHNLEDKLINMVTQFDGERQSVNRDMATINSRLLDGKVTICDLEEECERYREDCSIAVQLLQCKPSNFVAHKLNTLPLDLQDRVKCHLSQQEIVALENSAANPEPEPKLIRVPMMTFPPTAMLYSVSHVTPPETPDRHSNKIETVPMDVITKVLAPPGMSRKPRRIYICTRCHRDLTFVDKEVQTVCSFSDAPPGDSSPYSQTVYSKLHRAHSAGCSLQSMHASPPDSQLSTPLSSPPGGYTGYTSQALFTHQPGVHRSRLNSTDSHVDL